MPPAEPNLPYKSSGYMRPGVPGTALNSMCHWSRRMQPVGPENLIGPIGPTGPTGLIGPMKRRCNVVKKDIFTINMIE